MSAKALFFKNPVNNLTFPYTDELAKRKDLIPIYTMEDYKNMTTTDLDTVTLKYVKELRPDDFRVTVDNMDRMSRLFGILGFKETSVPVGLGAPAKAPAAVVPIPEAEIPGSKELTAAELADAENVLKDAGLQPAPVSATAKVDTNEPELTIEQKNDRISKLMESIGTLKPEDFRVNMGGLPLIEPLSIAAGFRPNIEEVKTAFDLYKEKKAAEETK